MGAVIVPSLLIDGEWIPFALDRCNTISKLAGLLIAESEILFPDSYLVEFDLYICLEDETEDPVKVDLVLVAKDCSSWHLLFVVPKGDVATSALRNDIETCTVFRPGAREVNYLASKISELKREDINTLVTVEPPKILVVTDDPRHLWSEGLSQYDFQLIVVEPFSKGEKDALRINGQYPLTRIGNCIARGRQDPILPNLLRIEGNLPSASHPAGPITLRYGEVETRWTLSGSVGNVLLAAEDRHPLPYSSLYDIFEDTDGTLVISPVSEEM